MKRYNIFYQVHKGLRAMLYETAILLQQTDFSNEEETNTIAECISEVVVLFDKHAHSEDSNILNTIESFEPSVAGLFAAEHVKDHELSNRLTALVNMLHAATLDQKKNNWEVPSGWRSPNSWHLTWNIWPRKKGN
ncbi:MAG: hypothetical protein IPJ02_01045 [Chitinophagaceae bacterium]|nr:hypothetical protein [Chitinophagaceae bacterium]